MERRIYSNLTAWKNGRSRKPLVLFGARQVGKTYALKEFARREYAAMADLDFLRDEAAQRIFDGSLRPADLVKRIESYLNMDIVPGHTLIVLDEVQLCERALTSLKYFCDEAPDYHVVAAGSLLGVKVNREKYSFPVGKVDIMVMHPLDFEEFLWAMDRRRLADSIREAVLGDASFALHDVALSLVHEYCLVGGMPEAVSAYVAHVESGAATQLAETRRVQANIEQGYVADMTKYAAPQDIPRIFEAWSSIPRQLAKENHKFQYKAVASGGRASRYEGALAWLRSAGIVASCTQVSEGVAPLAAFEDPSSFKLYMADTGLLASAYSTRPEDLMPSEGKAAGFRGAIAENYCLQQLSSAGITCHYWGTTSKSEVEFVARSKDGSVIPIEVKSGKNVRSNSLQKYRESYRPPYVVRASARNFGFENGVRSIPLYAIRAFADELDQTPAEQLLF